MSTLARRAVLLAPLLLAACVGEAPPPTLRSFPPLRYDYLTPLRLNVGVVDIGAPPPGPLDSQSPAPLGEALRRMGTDRLAAGGSIGRAVYVIDEASVVQSGGVLDGTAAVHLDIVGVDGVRAGFAEARVSRRITGVSRRELSSALYDLTRLMMDDMNVEFEFQVRRSLRDYVQDATTAPPPPAVEQQDLPVPGT